MGKGVEANGERKTDWAGVVDASLGIVGGGLEVAAGVFGEVLTGGLSTIAIADGVGRIGMNAFRLAAYTSGYSKVGRALPSNFGGMAGKVFDGAILKKGFYENGPGQNVMGITNDAAALVIGGGSNLPVILSSQSNAQLIRSTAGFALYHYDNFKPLLQRKK